jgi:tRNA dimethylallyltransferase
MDTEKTKIVLVVGPTASGKSKEAIRIAKERDGEVISVDSRQVYRGLDIGTEKITAEEMSGIPHYLIDIREPNEPYSAGDFVADSKRLISDITERGKLPILAGGSHFYIDALLYGLPEIELNEKLREELELLSDEELISEVQAKDSARFARLDPQNRRRLIRALEIIRTRGSVPERTKSEVLYEVEWVILNPERDVLRARIEARLAEALQRGLT